jgi:hypothetical protein
LGLSYRSFEAGDRLRGRLLIGSWPDRDVREPAIEPHRVWLLGVSGR